MQQPGFASEESQLFLDPKKGGSHVLPREEPPTCPVSLPPTPCVPDDLNKKKKKQLHTFCLGKATRGWGAEAGCGCAAVTQRPEVTPGHTGETGLLLGKLGGFAPPTPAPCAEFCVLR